MTLLPHGRAGELIPVVQVQKSGQADSSATTQAQIQGFELAHPKIYIIHELLGHMKGPVLLIRSGRISMTQGNKRITGRSPSEEPALMVSQKPETWVTHCNDHVRVCGERGTLWGAL